MSFVKNFVHALASMLIVVVGAVLANAVKTNVEVFRELSGATSHGLLEVGGFPSPRRSPNSSSPSVLMFVWVLLFERALVTGDG